MHTNFQGDEWSKGKYMCQEVFDIVKDMDLSNVETRLALQCAPVITGIKLSNLLTITHEDEELLDEILKDIQIQYYCLQRQEKKTIYLLYRASELVVYLQEDKVQNVLRQMGYKDLSIMGILALLQNRYVSYMKYRKEFPHELGILLGYPIEDVEGFINNKGENYLYAGYWKVYAEVEAKKALFDAYESAKEGLLLLLSKGYDLCRMLEFLEKTLEK